MATNWSHEEKKRKQQPNKVVNTKTTKRKDTCSTYKHRFPGNISSNTMTQGCLPRLIRKRRRHRLKDSGAAQSKTPKEVDINDMDFTDERRTWQNSMRDSQTGARYPGFSFTIVSSKDFRGSNSFRLSHYMPKFLQNRPESTSSAFVDTKMVVPSVATTNAHQSREVDSCTSASLRSSGTYSSDGLTDEDDFTTHRSSYDSNTDIDDIINKTRRSYGSTTDEDDLIHQRFSTQSDDWELPPRRSDRHYPSRKQRGSSGVSEKNKVQKPALPPRVPKANKEREIDHSRHSTDSSRFPPLQVGPSVAESVLEQPIDPSLVPPPPPFPPSPSESSIVGTMAASMKRESPAQVTRSNSSTPRPAREMVQNNDQAKPRRRVKQNLPTIIVEERPSKKTDDTATKYSNNPISPSRTAAMRSGIVKKSIKQNQPRIIMAKEIPQKLRQQETKSPRKHQAKSGNQETKAKNPRSPLAKISVDDKQPNQSLRKAPSGLARFWSKMGNDVKTHQKQVKHGDNNTQWERSQSGKWHSSNTDENCNGSNQGQYYSSSSPRTPTSKTHPWNHHHPQQHPRWRNMTPILEDRDVV